MSDHAAALPAPEDLAATLYDKPIAVAYTIRHPVDYTVYLLESDERDIEVVHLQSSDAEPGESA